MWRDALRLEDFTCYMTTQYSNMGHDQIRPGAHLAKFATMIFVYHVAKRILFVESRTCFEYIWLPVG